FGGECRGDSIRTTAGPATGIPGRSVRSGSAGLGGGHDGDLLEVGAGRQGGQEGDGVGDVLGGEPVHGLLGVGEPLLDSGVGDVALEFGADDAGLDGADADLLGAELGAQVAGEVGDVGLGRGVDGEGGEDVLRRDGGGVDQVGHASGGCGGDQLRGE